MTNFFPMFIFYLVSIFFLLHRLFTSTHTYKMVVYSLQLYKDVLVFIYLYPTILFVLFNDVI